MRTIKQSLWVCVIALLIAAAAWAQAPASLRGPGTDPSGAGGGGAASVRGTVAGPSGAGVPGASVALTGPDGLVRVVQSANDGSYAFTGLPPGTYTLRFAATGFALFESKPIELTAARAITADAKLVIAT